MPTEFWFSGRLDPSEVAVLAVQVGSRVFEVLDWVLAAHASLERRELPLLQRCGTAHTGCEAGNHTPGVCTRVQSGVIPAEIHDRAVTYLEDLLRACVAISGVTHWQLRARLLEAVPGIIFPEPTSASEFHNLVAAARNANLWLAARGTFRCSCAGSHLEFPCVEARSLN